MPLTLPDWARAHGGPLFTAAIRSFPEDFDVTEELGWTLSGDGEHDYVWLQKIGANTEWVARQVAQYADVPPRDVGYAGLKDRDAVTRQWFSVPRWNSPDWSRLDVDGVTVLDVQRHNRKLRRGAHRANKFRIVLRGEGLAGHADELAARIDLISGQGVPNYFGEQRFGRDAANLDLADAWADGKRLARHKRGLAISTVRSFLFNEQLDARVQAGTWNRLLAGDKANLNGTGSVFDVPEVEDDLARRCAELDIHPAGVLAGAGSSLGPDNWRAALDKARVEEGSRSFRLAVTDMDYVVESDAVTVSITLGRGAFATSVLREICRH